MSEAETLPGCDATPPDPEADTQKLDMAFFGLIPTPQPTEPDEKTIPIRR